MKENEKIINSVLNSCLTGYSVYDDDITECITKENRSLIRGLTRQEQLKLLCDIITMAYAEGQGGGKKQIEVAAKATETNDDADKLEFNNLISRDQYRKMKGMSRREFTDFLFDLYKSIYEEHQGRVTDYIKIRNEILKINGIGDVKADKIMTVIKNCLEIDEDEGDL